MVFPDSPCALGLDECLLCLDRSSSHNLSRKPTPWESVWSQSCAESVCKLLDLSVETFKPFFLSGQYCSSCKQMMRDVDYLIRTVDSFQQQLSEYRIKVSTLLNDNLESWIDNTNIPSPSTPFHQPGSTEASNACPSQRLQDDESSSLGSFPPCEIKVEEDDPYSSPFHSLYHHDDVDPVNCPGEPPQKPDRNWEHTHQPTTVSSVAVKKSSPKTKFVTLTNYTGYTYDVSVSRSERVTRGSNRLRNEVSYREDSDSDPEEPSSQGANANLGNSTDLVTLPQVIRSDSSTSQSHGVVVVTPGRKGKLDLSSEPRPPTGTKRSCEGERAPPQPNSILLNHSRKLDSMLKRRNGEKDPTFVISNDTKETDEDDGSDTNSEGGQEDAKLRQKLKEKMPKPNKRRRHPPEVTLRRKEYEDLATINFLRELDRERKGAENAETEKNYSYVCNSEDCNRRFVDLRKLRRHKINEHSEALFPCSYQCPFCPSMWFPFDYQLDAHIIRIHEGRKRCYICPVPDCPAAYKSQGNLKLVSHLQREHPNYPIEESRLTQFSFGVEHRDKTVAGLVPGTSNQRKIRGKSVRMLRCLVPGCDTRCGTQLILDFHHNKVHLNDPLPCKCVELGCTKAFKLYDSYTVHMKLQHGAIGKKGNVVNCLFCPYRCVGRGNLNLHMRRRHGRKDVPKIHCRFCGHLYFVKSDCEEHEKLHTPEAGFSCVIWRCAVQGLTSEEDLRAHIQTGHDEHERRKVVCDVCGAVQLNNERLMLHKRIHTGVEPFQCRHCEKRFKSQANRTSHEEIMHGDKMEGKTFNCKLCDATFTARQYLYKHNAWHKHGANANLPLAKKKSISGDLFTF